MAASSTQVALDLPAERKCMYCDERCESLWVEIVPQAESLRTDARSDTLQDWQTW